MILIEFHGYVRYVRYVRYVICRICPKIMDGYAWCLFSFSHFPTDTTHLYRVPLAQAVMADA